MKKDILLTSEHLYSITQHIYMLSIIGPWAAGLLLEAIIIMGLNARRKSKDL